jgi:hypothetical protein
VIDAERDFPKNGFLDKKVPWNNAHLMGMIRRNWRHRDVPDDLADENMVSFLLAIQE